MDGFGEFWDQRCGEYRDAANRLGGRPEIDPARLLTRDRELGPTGRSISPNGACHILRAQDGFVAVNLAREDDRDAVDAWLEADIDGDDLDAIEEQVAAMPAQWLRERAVLMHLPFAVAGEARPALPDHCASGAHIEHKDLSAIRVLDLSVLWAGPLCAALLAEAGASVLRWEHPSRRDPTAVSTPGHYAFLNAKKKLKTDPFDRSSLIEQVRAADIVITSARPHALARLGLTKETIFADGRVPVWVAVTAHGWNGADAMRVGFGDDCAVAGGLVDWADDRPVFAGDALADPLTGLEAARAVLQCLADGQSGVIDAALAPTASWYREQLGKRCADEM